MGLYCNLLDADSLSQLFAMIAMIIGAAARQSCTNGPTLTYSDVNGSFFIAIIVMAFIIQLVIVVLYVTALEKLGNIKPSWWLIVCF